MFVMAYVVMSVVHQPLPQVQQPLPQVQQPLSQVQQPLPQVQQPLPGVDNNNSGMLLMLLWLSGTSSTEIIIHDMTVSVKYIADICNYGVCICSYGRFYLIHSRVKNQYPSIFR